MEDKENIDLDKAEISAKIFEHIIDKIEQKCMSRDDEFDILFMIIVALIDRLSCHGETLDWTLNCIKGVLEMTIKEESEENENE